MKPALVIAMFLALLSLAAVPSVAVPLKAAGPILTPEAGILMLAPSVEEYQIGAGGQPVLQTEWTAAAHEHVRAALQSELVRRKARVVTYRAPEAPAQQLAHLQVFKVHS